MRDSTGLSREKKDPRWGHPGVVVCPARVRNSKWPWRAGQGGGAPGSEVMEFKFFLQRCGALIKSRGGSEDLSEAVALVLGDAGDVGAVKALVESGCGQCCKQLGKVLRGQRAQETPGPRFAL